MKIFEKNIAPKLKFDNKSTFFRPKLTINQPNDIYEQEADAVSEQIMRMPINKDENTFFPARNSLVKPVNISSLKSNMNLNLKCAECEDEEKLQRKEDNTGEVEAGNVLESFVGGLNSGGDELPNETKKFFEPRFGYDFSNVRIHNDSVVANSAQSINALAYTSGNSIVFNKNQYSPETNSGKRLLGHELTHVVQQKRVGQNIQRDRIDDLNQNEEEISNKLDNLFQNAEEFTKEQLDILANEPVVKKSVYQGEAKCGPTFCQPFADRKRAELILSIAGPIILAGIATKVNPKVLGLWSSYLLGGSFEQSNLTAEFGSDFTASPTTAKTTKYLIGELIKYINANKGTLMEGVNSITIDFTKPLSSELSAIDKPLTKAEMDFNYPSDIAGNIAGGIGKDEESIKIGAKPSNFNDSRKAVITATLILNDDSSITVYPWIRYTVTDTIDLCPGDCGNPDERVATIPLSRFEATGLTGDVPLKVHFDAPQNELSPLLIPPSKPHGLISKAKTALTNFFNFPNWKIQKKCAECTEEEQLPRKENGIGEAEAANELGSYMGNINSGGNALPNNVRSFFEPRFGYDFSNVRIHNDSAAAKSAQSINALAYTSRNNIVFNENQYSPKTDNGKKLLAHELTHVVQQNNSSQRETIYKEEDTESVKVEKITGTQIQNRPIKPSDPTTQMSALLEIAKKNAVKMAGKCYRQFKENIKEAKGYGDILDIYYDERFKSFQFAAVDFASAVDSNGVSGLGLEEVSGLPTNAEVGTILVIKGNGKQQLSETYGDISIIGGVENGVIICYNDGVMKLPASEKSWNEGKYKGVLLGMYKPVSRQ